MAKAKEIFIPGTNMSFPSVSAASKALGINAGNISSVLAGRRKSAGGYKFGYTSNRTIYIPETGQTFNDIKSAAKSVNVGTKKAVKGLEGRSGSAIGGYHFEYADITKVSQNKIGTSEAASSVYSRRKKNKKTRAKEKREKRKQQKTKKTVTVAQKTETDYAKQQRQEQKDRAAYKRAKKKADKVTSSMDELTNLLQRVNEQLELYYDNKMMGYSRAAQDVAEFQNYLGTTEDGLFDLSDENIKYLSETYTPEDVYQWKKQIEDEINSKEGKFWDLKGQMEEREHYALQFNIPIGQLDDIADLLPDLWDVLELANTKQKKGSKVDGTWDTIKDAVQGTITRDAMASLIDNLRQFWSGNRTRQLDEILADLNQYKSNPSPLMMDDDELPF